MAKACASNWKKVDAATKWYCDSVARIQKARYKALHKNQTMQLSRVTAVVSSSSLMEQANSSEAARNLTPRSLSSPLFTSALPNIQRAAEQDKSYHGYARTVSSGCDEQQKDPWQQQPLPQSSSSPLLSQGDSWCSPTAAEEIVSFDHWVTPDFPRNELVFKQEETPAFCELTRENGVDLSDDDIINAWLLSDM